jgi:SidE phosphodiesterase (PDE) domain
MTQISKIRNTDELINFLEEVQAEPVAWYGSRKFSYKGDSKNLMSMNQIVQKAYDCSRSEFPNEAQLKSEDKEKLKIIKEKISVLDKESYKKLGSRNFITRIIHFFLSLFGGSIKKKNGCLFNQNISKESVFKGISQKINRSTEKEILQSKIAEDLGSTISDQVKDALQYSYDKFYKNPYSNTKIRKKEAKWKVEGEMIDRYNHGLASATRKAYYVPVILDYFLRHGHNDIVKKLEGLIEEDSKENVIAKLQIVMAFEVAGRESECGSRDNLEEYKTYLAASKKAFETYCEDRDLIGDGKLFKDENELAVYAQAIEQKYENRFKEEDMCPIAAIADAAHTLDEFRCYWPKRMVGEIEVINSLYTKDKNNRDLKELSKYCQILIKVTGDRLMSELNHDPINARKISFKNGNLSAILVRNFRLTNPLAFVNCSKDVGYGIDLLEKIPLPVSFSRGESTYDILNENEVISESDHSPREVSTFQELGDIIRGTRAAIRLVDTKPSNIGFELTMINDPVFFRPTRSCSSDRNMVLKSRETGELVDRGWKAARTPLKEQIEESQIGRPDEADKWGPVHQSKDRGKAKFTKHAKKLSFSLLRKDAKVNHFTGVWPKSYYTYKPVGMLYDVNDLNQKKQKYVFDLDVGTSSKFWVGKKSPSRLGSKKGRKTDLSLEDLQGKLDDRVEKGIKPQRQPFFSMQHASNEMLMSPEKSSLKALFSVKDRPTERMRTLIEAVHLAHDYGIHVPVLVLDGKNPARVYSKECLKKDLEKIAKKGSKSEKTLLRHLYSCFNSDKPSKTKLTDNLFQQCVELFGDLLPEESTILSTTP